MLLPSNDQHFLVKKKFFEICEEEVHRIKDGGSASKNLYELNGNSLACF